MSDYVRIDYTNWKGVRATRLIEPQRVYFGKTEYHKKEQLLLEALDVHKQELRVFAVADIHAWDGAIGVLIRAVQPTLAAEVIELNMTGPTPGKHLKSLRELEVGTKLYTLHGLRDYPQPDAQSEPEPRFRMPIYGADGGN